MNFLNKIALNLSEAIRPKELKKKGSFQVEGNAINAEDYFYFTPKTGGKWYPYGAGDRSPYYFEQLAEGSATHAGILKTKSSMISGEGLLYGPSKTKEESLNYLKTLKPLPQAEVRYLEENKLGHYPIQAALDVLADNYVINGAFAYLVTWNKDFTKISSYRPLNIKYLRAAVLEGEEDEVKKYYYFEGDFLKAKLSDFEIYYVYNQADREHKEQIVYEKDGFNKIYGTPSYRGAFDWILIDIELGTFHKANIKNGMNPSLHFKFYTVPESEEEKQLIINQIKKNWQGAINTGRFVPTFSPNKDLATEISPIETSGVDKQLVNLTELADRKIISGHQLPSPLLAGVSTAGQLGSNVELKTAFAIWNNLVIKKMRQRIEISLTKHIFSKNLQGLEVSVLPFNPIQELIDAEEKKTV